MKPEDIRVCVIRIEGTNCEDEMAYAFRSVGAQAEEVHLKQLIKQAPAGMQRDLEDYDVLAFPGGFSPAAGALKPAPWPKQRLFPAVPRRQSPFAVPPR